MEKPRVLHIDDNIDARVTMESLLRKRRYDVVSVANVEDALQRQGESFDLIICDDDLGIDVTALGARTRLRGAGMKAPFAVLTGDPNLVAAGPAGFGEDLVGFWNKDLLRQPDAFVEKVEQALIQQRGDHPSSTSPPTGRGSRNGRTDTTPKGR